MPVPQVRETSEGSAVISVVAVVAEPCIDVPDNRPDAVRHLAAVLDPDALAGSPPPG